MKLLVAHPRLEPPGGGEAVGAWAIQALQDHHDVTLAVARPVDFAALNRFYGTEIDVGRIRVVVLPASLRAVVAAIPTRAGLVESSLLYRWIRTLDIERDLLVSTSNEWDFGEPALQYLHFPRTYLPRPGADLRWYHLGSSRLVAFYQRICRRLGRADMSRVARNVTLANSSWTARHFAEAHGATARVVHPPVPGDFPEVPWESRTHRFLCVGRVSPEKRVEDAIEIVARLRERGEDVGLDIVGAPDGSSYGRRIGRIVDGLGAWVTWRRNLPRTEYVRYLADRRFGLHPMPDEHFGIAAAELLQAGCVPFVRAGGGPLEIVGADSRLTYASVEEAVDKIVSLLHDPDALGAVRAALAGRRDMFSAERFMSSFRAAVEGAVTAAVEDAVEGAVGGALGDTVAGAAERARPSAARGRAARPLE